MEGRSVVFGGQAVIEGVMMRGAGRMAIAVRRADGSIQLETRPYRPWGERSRFLRLPLVRGAVALVEALVVGVAALNFSARVADEDDRTGPAGGAGEGDQAGTGSTPRGPSPEAMGTGTAAGQRSGPAGSRLPEAGGGRWPAVPAAATRAPGREPSPREGPAADRWLVAVNVFAVIAALLLFVLLPTWVADGLAHSALGRNGVEGAVRLALLLAYMGAIGRVPDIRRVYEYHGAEHKAIHALEAGAPLTPEAARGFSRFHPRCGTAFLLFVAVLAVIVHAFFGWPAVWARTLLRLLLVPVIAGLAFEWIRLAGRSSGRWIRAISAPGMWLQRLTTAEPSDDQLEVALAALRACLGDRDTRDGGEAGGAHTPPPRAVAAPDTAPAARPAAGAYPTAGSGTGG